MKRFSCVDVIHEDGTSDADMRERDDGEWVRYAEHESAMAAAEAALAKAQDFIARRGYVRCDIPACNCGSWHGGSAEDRLREISDALDGRTNGSTILAEIEKLMVESAERDQLRASLAEAQAKSARLESILQRSFELLPIVPGDPIAWGDFNLEPHAVRVADEYAIMREQRDSYARGLAEARELILKLREALGQRQCQLHRPRPPGHPGPARGSRAAAGGGGRAGVS